MRFFALTPEKTSSSPIDIYFDDLIWRESVFLSRTSRLVVNVIGVTFPAFFCVAAAKRLPRVVDRVVVYSPAAALMRSRLRHGRMPSWKRRHNFLISRLKRLRFFSSIPFLQLVLSARHLRHSSPKMMKKRESSNESEIKSKWDSKIKFSYDKAFKPIRDRIRSERDLFFIICHSIFGGNMEMIMTEKLNEFIELLLC